MKKEDSRKEILKSVRRYIQQSEEKQRIQLITDALGDRRDRDLQDILSQIEQEQGWQEIVRHLTRIHDFQYALPIGAGPLRSNVEILKLREGIFSFLSCCGLEPVPITTMNLIHYLKTTDSWIDASHKVRDYLESMATEQIQSGDTLFFDTSLFDEGVSDSLVENIERIQQEQLQTISIFYVDNEYDIHSLWYNEIGRQALSMLGIKGSRITQDQMDTVSSVIQSPLLDTRNNNSTKPLIHEPSNENYRVLLDSMINHDMDNLRTLGSKLSYPFMKGILEESLDQYIASPTSESFRKVLNGINAHIRIRALDSIGLLERLAHSDDIRLATTAITALGNFYHESSVSVLVDILCNTKNQEIIKMTISAILNVSKRCAETGFVITNTLESNQCSQNKHLKRLQKEIVGKRLNYYL